MGVPPLAPNEAEYVDLDDFGDDEAMDVTHGQRPLLAWFDIVPKDGERGQGVATHARYDRKAVMQAVSSHPDGASPGRTRGGGGDEATLGAAGQPGEPKDGGLICGDG
jgi:hypothetical protein